MKLHKGHQAGDSITPSAESLPSETQNAQLASRNPNRVARNTQRVKWWIINLGQIDYDEAWKLQTDIVGARNRGELNADTILVLEHPAVFTLGRRGGAENLLVSEAFLEESGIAVTQVERGGNITHHGPGQLVVYPIIDLEAAKISVIDFVHALEEVMLQTAGVWGIKAGRNSSNHGIWVENQKLGSVGIAIRKGISFHGLALNVNLDLTPFTWIQPCGLQGVQMTSMAKELSGEVSMSKVRDVIKNQFEAIFNVQCIDKSGAELVDTLASNCV